MKLEDDKYTRYPSRRSTKQSQEGVFIAYLSPLFEWSLCFGNFDVTSKGKICEINILNNRTITKIV